MQPHIALALALVFVKKRKNITYKKAEVQLYAYRVKTRSGKIRDMKTLGRNLAEARMFARREVEGYGGRIIEDVSLNKVYQWVGIKT